MGVLLSPQDFAGSIGSIPSTGAVRVGSRTFAGADFLGFRTAQGIERIVMPHIARTAFVGWLGTGGSALSITGTAAPTAVGGTARSSGASSMATRAKRTGFVSAATAGAFSSCYGQQAMVAMGSGSGLGGFLTIIRFVVSDGAPVAGARMFIGLSSAGGAPTNVEPAGLPNHIGIAQLAGSANLQIVFGGSSAQTPIDLGPNFPAAGASADLYELALFSDPNDNSRAGYRVERMSTGNVSEGTLTNTTPGTTLPGASTMMAMRMWRTNNATALAVGFDIVSAVTVWDF